MKKHAFGLFVSWAIRGVAASQPKRLKKFLVEKSHATVSTQLPLKRLIHIEYGLNQLFLTLHQILRAYTQASQKTISNLLQIKRRTVCLSQLLEIKFTNHDVALCDAILRVTQISTFDKSFYIRLETGIRRICI